jgi:hypothetical protein
MDSNFISYIHLLIIVPLLIYLGISIVIQRSNSTLFSFLFLFTLLLILSFHIEDIVNISKQLFNNVNLEKNFGYFLIILALFFIFINVLKLKN